jgi:hypothetical protein
MARQEIKRTPNKAHNPEAQECTSAEQYDAAQREIAEHSMASHEEFLRLRKMQEEKTSSARDELEERYWTCRFEADRIHGEKIQSDQQTFRDRSKR